MTGPRKQRKPKLRNPDNQSQIPGFVDECRKAGILLKEQDIEEGSTVLTETKPKTKSRRRRRSTTELSTRKRKPNNSDKVIILEEELCVTMASTE